MSLHPWVAEGILRARLAEPIKSPTQKVIGFKTTAGRILALHREATETRVWFMPPTPPPFNGITLMLTVAINSNLNAELDVLNNENGLRAEVDNEAALHRFLDWYGAPAVGAQLSVQGELALDLDAFRSAFKRFKTLILFKSGGHPFANFREGLAAAWEDYKPRLRDHALGILDPGTWTSDAIGSGVILERTITAIEIYESRTKRNNLVLWQNQYGHANREHRALLEARTNPRLRTAIEGELYALLRTDVYEATTFDRLAALTYTKCPLLASLFFLKDMDRFLPIRPTTFDRAFRDMNIDLVTVRNCSWQNYTRYNAAIAAIRDALTRIEGIQDARLIDAHSFCWLLERMEAPEPGADAVARRRGQDVGRIFGPREKSIWEMKASVLQTVSQARGQIEERKIKLKELRMTEGALEALIAQLMEQQDDRCALTGLPFQFRGVHDDPNSLPSLDRIDSNGHYENGNLQVVCRFVNFWKQDADNEEFKRLLMLVRGIEE